MKTKPWSEIRQGAEDPVRRARVDSYRHAMHEASALSELREHRGVTQVELAHRLGTAQSGVSRIERREDLFLSTLADYVHALGGRLEVAAVFEDDRVPITIGEPQEIAASSTTA